MIMLKLSRVQIFNYLREPTEPREPRPMFVIYEPTAKYKIGGILPTCEFVIFLQVKVIELLVK